MKEYGQERNPSFQENANEFIIRVNTLSETFRSLNFVAVNFTLESIDLKTKVIKWYEKNNFQRLANIEKEEVKIMQDKAKSECVVMVSGVGNNYDKIEDFVSELDFLVNRLNGVKLVNPIFTDWADKNKNGFRFSTTQQYRFNKDN